ncbi:hypothetical protein CR513_56940, partial [Mucuna pruriens]
CFKPFDFIHVDIRPYQRCLSPSLMPKSIIITNNEVEINMSSYYVNLDTSNLVYKTLTKLKCSKKT